MRLDVGEEVGEHRAGHAHQASAHRRRDQLEPERGYAGTLRRHLVVADRREAQAEGRGLHETGNGHRASGHERHDREEELDEAAEAEGRAALEDDVRAARAADVIPVHYEGEEHLGERERGDGEEDPAQPQREIPHP